MNTKYLAVMVVAIVPSFAACVAGEEPAPEPAVGTAYARYSGEGAGSCRVTRVESTEPTCIDHDNSSGTTNPAVITRITGTGLPVLTDGSCDKELINFIYTDSEGPGGFVLGCTNTGTWTVDVCGAPPGTYSFVSRGYGSGKNVKYTHFADCSAP